jgi:hypothetical protein
MAGKTGCTIVKAALKNHHIWYMNTGGSWNHDGSVRFIALNKGFGKKLDGVAISTYMRGVRS